MSPVTDDIENLVT